MNSADPDPGNSSENAVVESLEAAITVINQIDVSGSDDRMTLDVLKLSEKLMAAAQALQTRHLTRFAEHRPPDDVEDQFHNSAIDEIAVELRWSTRQDGGRLWHAWRITRRTPALLAGLTTGVLDHPKTLILDHETRCLPDNQARAVIDRMMPGAGNLTSAQLTRRVRRAVLRADPRAADQRHTQARVDRHVTLVPDDDGMAELIGRLPADVATRAYSRINEIARHATTADDPRGIDAVRADVFADLLLGNPTVAVKPGRTEIRVTVPADTLAGITDEPGELEGYGPIPPRMARRLATTPDTVWRRLITEPVDGTLLDYGRTTYRPPVGLADYVRARDRTCTFPGCMRTTGDLDHTIPYPTGPTSADNLRLTCRRHHLLKQHKGWTVRQDGDHTTWITPTRRTYHHYPEPPGAPPTVPLTKPPDNTDPDPPPF